MNGSGGYPTQQGGQQSGGWDDGGVQQDWGQAQGSGAYAAAGAGGYPPGAYPPNEDFGYAAPGYDQGYGEPETKSRTGVVVLSSLAVLLIILLSALSLTLWVTNRDSGESGETGISAQNQQPDGQNATASGADGEQSAAAQKPSSAAPSSTKRKRPDPPAGVSLCGTADGELFSRAGSANSVTSCPFAQSVRDAYVASGADGKAATVSAYSPVTGRTYSMNCTPAGENVVRCTGGNNAVVYVY